MELYRMLYRMLQSILFKTGEGNNAVAILYVKVFIAVTV